MRSISVIIPVFNDPQGIDATLESVVNQTHPDYEIIPVDNNSTDDTPGVIRKWTNRHPSLISPATERDTQSSYAARNTGIKNAEGDIVVFIDANMTAPESWLDQIETALSESTADYLGYEIEMYIPDGEKSFWGWYDCVMGLPSRYHFEQKHFVPTSSLAVRQTVFERVGLFDETLQSGGDKDFGLRVHRHPDLETAFRDEILVYHPARTDFAEHFHKAIRIGRGMAQLANTTASDDDSPSPIVELLLHLLPPNPVRLRRHARGVSPVHLPALYLADLIVRYARLYGALTYFVGR